MTIARRMRLFLDAGLAPYALVPRTAFVPPEALAKAMLLRDDKGYMLAVLPASQRLAIERVCSDLGRALELASERELAAIFNDCTPASIPPFGAAYGIPTIVDDSLLHQMEVHFEVGCDESLARMPGSAFANLLPNCTHGDYAATSERPETRAEPLKHAAAKDARDRRLVEGLTHVFSLRSFGAGLRGHAEYERNGHAGMLLLKTPELRIVLEAMRADTALRTHFVHGPTTLFVLEGALVVTTPQGTFRVGESEMATLPREERREIHSGANSLFLLALGRLARPEDSERSSAEPAAAGQVETTESVDLTDRTHRGLTRRRRILVVANQTAASAHLIAAVRHHVAVGPCDFVVLAPAVASHKGWTWGENAARDEAQIRLDTCCASLRELGAGARGTVGDFYPVRAIQDLLLVEPEGFDEIVLSTLPAPISEWLKLDLPARIWRRFGIPVTHVEAEE